MLEPPTGSAARVSFGCAGQRSARDGNESSDGGRGPRFVFLQFCIIFVSKLKSTQDMGGVPVPVRSMRDRGSARRAPSGTGSLALQTQLGRLRVRRLDHADLVLERKLTAEPARDAQDQEPGEL